MSVLQAAQMGGILMVIVFLVLGILFLCVLIFSQLLKLFAKPKPATATASAPAKPAAPTPAVLRTSAPPAAAPSVASPAQAVLPTALGTVSGAVRLYNVDDSTANTLMDIVSRESGTPLSNLVFSSIAHVEPSSAHSNMRYVVTLNGESYEISAYKGRTHLVGAAAPAPVPSPASASAPAPAQAPVAPVGAPAEISPAPAAAFAPSGGEAINSPMPGTILTVSVASGDTIKAGQILLILEAMKMENEILAPHDGVVASVAVTKGQNVGPGEALLYIN